MTTKELLAKLEAEYTKLESELPGHYLDFGKYAYWYPKDLETVYQTDKYEIGRKLKRQAEIREIQNTIETEVQRI